MSASGEEDSLRVSHGVRVSLCEIACVWGSSLQSWVRPLVLSPGWREGGTRCTTQSSCMILSRLGSFKVKAKLDVKEVVTCADGTLSFKIEQKVRSIISRLRSNGIALSVRPIHTGLINSSQLRIVSHYCYYCVGRAST